MGNAIQVKGDFIREEGLASATIKPGYLVELESAGTYKPHATAGGFSAGCFAIENSLAGLTTADSYTSGQLVQVNYQRPGNKVQAILKAGQNVAKGAHLCASTDGTLVAIASAGSGVTVKQIFIAEQALNLSASGAVATLITVRVC
jgi:hypothetical protein